MDQHLTRMMRESMPLCATLAMRTHAISPTEAVVSLEWAPELCTSSGVLHGGVVMALADTAGAIVAMHNLPEGAAGTSTIESKSNFLGAIRGGTVTATARPLHVGRSTIVVETEVMNTDRLVAKVTQTQSVLQPR